MPTLRFMLVLGERTKKEIDGQTQATRRARGEQVQRAMKEPTCPY